MIIKIFKNKILNEEEVFGENGEEKMNYEL